jgi:MFS transporter, DHA2 family, multidrug resistance protein
MARALRYHEPEPEAAPPAPARPTARPAAARPAPTARDWLGFLIMVGGMFMAILDIQIVSSSLSEIQAGLSASADEISWVQTSYLIAEVIMIPLSGFLARLLSTRVLFVLSAAGFTVMSVACAMAWSIGSMVVFRCLQGFLGGAMIPTVFATSFRLVPPERHAVVSVMIGLVATMAPTLGPTLGGYVTEAASWHWLFLINVLPGLLVALGVFALIDVDRPDRSLLKGFDLTGLLTMALFLGSLEYVLEEGPRDDWFQNDLIATLAVVGLAAAALFFWRVLTYGRPIVDLRAFADRNFALGSLYSFIIGVGLYGSVYLLPLFLARVRGLNSLQIGLIMIVTGSAQFLSAPVAGALSKKLDLRVMLVFGLSLFALGLWLNSFLTAESGFLELFLPQAVRGFALMFCFIPINTLALGTLPPEKLNNASGLYNLMRNLGGAIGLAALNTVLIDRLNLHWARLGEQINLARPVVQARLEHLTGMLGTVLPGDPQHAAIRMLGNLVMREATVLTFNDALLGMAAAFLLTLVFMPLVHKPAHPTSGGH